MQRWITSGILLLILSSCGGSSVVTDCTELRWFTTFGTCVPAGWRVMEKEDLRRSGIPVGVFLGFQREEGLAGQYPLVLVAREALPEPLSSADYNMTVSNVLQGISDYESLDERSVKINGEDLDLQVFVARPSIEGPRWRFFQVNVVSGSVGYSLTGGGPVSMPEEIEKEILQILVSASFKMSDSKEE